MAHDGGEQLHCVRPRSEDRVIFDECFDGVQGVGNCGNGLLVEPFTDGAVFLDNGGDSLFVALSTAWDEVDVLLPRKDSLDFPDGKAELGANFALIESLIE